MKIIGIIYFIGLLSGLLFPVMDDLLLRYCSIYREESGENDIALKIYRQGPWYYKLLSAVIPVINLIWVLLILLSFWLIYTVWINRLKNRFIEYLAKKPIKKGFIFRTKLVKKLFPRKVSYYYKCIARYHTTEISDNIIWAGIAIIAKMEADKEINLIIPKQTENDEQQRK